MWAAGAILLLVAISVVVLLVGDRIVRSAAPDCEDADRLVGEALANLERVEGYRWTEEGQMWGFDPDEPISASDPKFAWSGYRAEGAYLAPDRMVARTIASTGRYLIGVQGFLDFRIIEGRAFGYSGEDAGHLAWQELRQVDEEPNRIRGFLRYGAESWTAEPVDLTWSLPGRGGCEVFGVVDGAGEGVGAYNTALRIDGRGRIVGAAFGLIAEGEPRNDQARWRWEVLYEVPAATEFRPPEGPVYTYPPESSP
jgi:hypothetical protein